MRDCICSIFRLMYIRTYWLRNIKLLCLIAPIYLLNRRIRYNITVPFIGYLCRCHLNDFIGGIAFCIYFNFILFLSHRAPITKLRHLLLLMVPVSLAWEFIFPLFIPYSTSDIFDVFAYLLGTISYYAISKCYLEKA